jgi:hypothetical protein
MRIWDLQSVIPSSQKASAGNMRATKEDSLNKKQKQ